MAPTTRFGPYEIIRPLGRSMNDVYLARDTRANRQAALKLIKAGNDAVSRLVMEAERRGAAIQQRLRALDPRVIEVYDYGDLEGYFFVAMQYVEGRNLAEVLAHDGRMSAMRAAHIALEICGQLQKFHTFQAEEGGEAPVVHGDIKPSNVHLGPNETVRLLDFGIAKTLRPNRDFTYHNFGSPGYCSPERLDRSLVDQQADLWAVAVTLYEMVAGRPPYQAEDTHKLEQLIQSRRPPRALPASCPAPLKAVIRKALAPDVARRYASAALLAMDLRAFLDGAETFAEQERRGGWRPHPTLEAGHAPAPAKSPRGRARRVAAQIGLGTACVLTGMLLFIGTSLSSRYWTGSREVRASLDWDLYQDLDYQFAFLGGLSPVNGLRAELRSAYQRAAAQAIARGDWGKAEPYLAHAAVLGATDKPTRARLAYARGHFAEAAELAPEWPDPHVALAQMKLARPEEARAEMETAQRLGYKATAKDTWAIADAFRARAFEELEAGDVAAARSDFGQARGVSPDIEVPDLAPRAPRHKPRVRRWR
ncbi:MAG TPA: serine/threonine-protein kinase [Bryobacteraceae bacterium]|nr:serine/threonine-protein kinase [Bryobacteraceae bacterium]